MRRLNKFCSILLAMLMAASMLSVTAFAKEYTYQATIYAGNQGRFSSGVDIRVNNKKSGSGYRIDRSGTDKIVITGLKKGDVVSIDVAAPGAVTMESGSKYYVKGLRDSGEDNDRAGQGAFRVDRDRDFVVAYGMKAQETSYTVHYETVDGMILDAMQTYYGNVGDKPVTAYHYIEGYMPLSYNLTKTLSENPSENDMTFLYVPEQGEEIVIRVPGEIIEEHIPGETVTVNVPGPVIVQRPSSSGTPAVSDGTDNGQIAGNNGQPADNNGQLAGQTQGGDQNQASQGNQAQNGDSNTTSQGNQAQQGGADPSGGQSNTPGTTDPVGNNSQLPGLNQGANSNQGQSQGTNNGQGTASKPVDLPGIGGHGSRDDGNATGTGQDPAGGTTDSDASYKPGGSRDVIISSNYEPSQLVDLDENPSGVPMDDAPDANNGMDDMNDGQGDGQGDGADENHDQAQDGMNENQDGTGTGNMEPEKKGLPIVPIVIAAVVLVLLIVGGVLFAYKRQQGSKDGDGE